MKQQADEYIGLALAYENGLVKGDTHLADSSLEKLDSIYFTLKANGEAELFLPSLLKHDQPAVRFISACHLLNFPKYRSVDLLKELSTKDTVVALVAEVTIDLFEAGEITY